MKIRVFRGHERRHWPSPSILIAGAALFVALGGSAAAASGLIHSSDIAPGAVTSHAIRNGGVQPMDLSTTTRALMAGTGTVPGPKGDTGPSGASGVNGTAGAAGVNGANGANGPNGPNGANGVDGTDGANGAKGIDGTNGTNGVNGTNGTIAPLSATAGLTALPTVQLVDYRGQPHRTGRELCRLGKDRAVPHGSR